MWWDRMLDWLLRHHRPLPAPELDAALEDNAAAHRAVAREKARLGARIAEQRRETEGLLSDIETRIARQEERRKIKSDQIAAAMEAIDLVRGRH